MPESGLPIRVYEEHDVWHVDYGEGETDDYPGQEEGEAAADAMAQAEERTVVLEELRPAGSSQNQGAAIVSFVAVARYRVSVVIVDGRLREPDGQGALRR